MWEVGLYSVAVNPEGTRVYVTNPIPGTVKVIEAFTNKIIATRKELQ